MDPRTILNDCGETYDEKNDDYGDSWRLVGEFMWLLANDGVELRTKEDFISFGLYTRRLDKLARAFNGEFNDDSMNFESVVDSHEDEATYAAMHASNEYDREVAEQGLPEPGPGEKNVIVPEDTDIHEHIVAQAREENDGDE